jgi:circadian clock protein KaiB
MLLPSWPDAPREDGNVTCRQEAQAVTARGQGSYVFTLFVSGDDEQCELAVARLRSLCESRVPGRYRLEVIDVAERPDLAEEERIVVTPTVVRRAPFPERRVMGDLSDDIRTAAALGFPDPGQLPRRRTEHDER